MCSLCPRPSFLSLFLHCSCPSCLLKNPDLAHRVFSFFCESPQASLSSLWRPRVPPPQLSVASPCDTLSPWSCSLPVPWQTFTLNQCCLSTSLPLCLNPWCSREMTSAHSLSPGLCQHPGSAEALVLVSSVSHFL